MWPYLIEKAKHGGVDVIETYVFWDGHEPSPGKVVSLQMSILQILSLHCFLFFFL